MSKKLLVTASLMCSFLTTYADTTPGPDFMYSLGKMYVVVAVLVLVFIGIVLYMAYMDRRISRLEEFIDNE